MKPLIKYAPEDYSKKKSNHELLKTKLKKNENPLETSHNKKFRLTGKNNFIHQIKTIYNISNIDDLDYMNGQLYTIDDENLHYLNSNFNDNKEKINSDTVSFQDSKKIN